MITTADIKLMASARMNDEADGGGRMSGNALQDAAENNVFPDISSLNRAQGALQFRKVFPAVLAAGTDTLLGTHVVLDDTPDDADVFSILIPATGDAQDATALAAALNASGENYAYRGQTSLTAIAAAAASTLSVAGLRTPLIPKTATSEAASGELATATVSPTVTAWESSGSTVALAVSGGTTIVPSPYTIGMRLKPGSTSGTYTTASGSGTITSDLNGNLTLTGGGLSATLAQGSSAAFYTGSTNLSGILTLSATAEVMVEVGLPSTTLRFPTVAGQTTYVLSVPAATALNSLSFAFQTYETPVLGGGAMLVTTNVTANWGKELLAGFGSGGLPYTNINYASLSRSTGSLTLVFPIAPPAGTEIVVKFAVGGQTTALPAASLVSSGLFTAGSANVTIGGGLVFGGAAFLIVGGEYITVRDGVARNESFVVRGAASDAGVITIPGNDGRTISNWYAVQRNPVVSVSAFDGVLPVDLQPATLVITGDTALGAGFTATANAAGVFATAHVTGTYNSVTGALVLAFASATNLYSLEYAATRSLPITSTADLQGLTEGSFSSDGTVPVIHVSDVVVLHHSADVAAATYANGNTVNCGRTDLASVRIIGDDGASILTGWTANLTTGVVTVSDISDWDQPVVVRHTIEHMAVVSGLPTSQSVLLNRALTREFPSGSRLSSALVLGDLAAQTSVAYSQQTWTEVWSDTRIGSGISAQYQQLTNPIVVSNIGAVNERWSIIFTTSTAFRVVGETLGQITTGDINSVLSPINPATAQPYFTLAALGWGGGWSAGNVLRFNTRGANFPVWVARSVRPSAPNSIPDSLTLAIRGDIDA